nr:hypothetical protein [uncultured Massilia sp.]
MDVTKMTSQELGEQIQAICAGKLAGEEAAQVLRAAVRHYNEGEEGLELFRAGIERAEERLAYGSSGRPVRRYPSSFGSIELETRSDSNHSVMPQVNNRHHSIWDADIKLISQVRDWANKMELARDMGMPASITSELAEALLILEARK